MPKMNLRRVVVVDDKHGNPQGFGPGEADVPQWAIEALEARGTNVESLKVPKAETAKAPAEAKTVAPASA